MENELDAVEKSLYETKGDTLETVLKTEIRKETAAVLNVLFNNLDKESVLKDLRLRMSKISLAEITIAIDPTESLIEKISNWLIQNSQTKYILDIKVDKTIIGGAIFAVNGKYFDDSLKTKLENTLKNYV